MGEINDSLPLSSGDYPPLPPPAIEANRSAKRKKVIVYEDEDVNQVSLPQNNDEELHDNDDDDGDDDEVIQDTKPIGNVVRVSGEGESRRNHFLGFEVDGVCYELEDTVLVSPEELNIYMKPSVSIIKDISETSDGRIMVTGRRFYRPEFAEKEDGGNWESEEERELFYSFEVIEFVADSVMHKCCVHFVPPNKTIPSSREHPGFIVDKVYDAKLKRLCAILDVGYGDSRQHELFKLVQKTMDRIPNWSLKLKFPDKPSNPLLIDMDVDQADDPQLVIPQVEHHQHDNPHPENPPPVNPTIQHLPHLDSSPNPSPQTLPTTHTKQTKHAVTINQLKQSRKAVIEAFNNERRTKHKYNSQQSTKTIPESIDNERRTKHKFDPHSNVEVPIANRFCKSNIQKFVATGKDKRVSPNSDSDFEEPHPVRTTGRKKQKPVKNEPLKNESSILKKKTAKVQSKARTPVAKISTKKVTKKQNEKVASKMQKQPDTIFLRTSPKVLFDAFHNLSIAQKEYVKSIGFGALLDISVDGIPSHIGHYAVRNFDCEKMVLNVHRGQLPVNRKVIHQLLGLPLGTVTLESLEYRKPEDLTYDEWKEQFKMEKDIRPKGVLNKILLSREVDLMFKVNFFVLICNTLGQSMSMGTCDMAFLSKVTKDIDLSNIDWCSIVMQSIKSSIPSWNATGGTGYFVGPITLLSLLYLEGIRFDALKVERGIPAICYWTAATMRLREDMEYISVGFGMGELQGPFIPSNDSHQEDNNEEETVEAAISTITEMQQKLIQSMSLLDAKINESIQKYPDNNLIQDCKTKYLDLFKNACQSSDKPHSQQPDPISTSANKFPSPLPISVVHNVNQQEDEDNHSVIVQM